MKIRDIILVEATPDSIGENQWIKLYNAMKSKQDHLDDPELAQADERLYGNKIANIIFQHVGPKTLQWVVKQYINDNYFFLHDLDAWKNTLGEFATITRNPRVQIERDLNKYKNVDEYKCHS